jgi:hypothetical protein
MHRLIPSRYSESGTVLEEVTNDEAMLGDAAQLDAATNERDFQAPFHVLQPREDYVKYLQPEPVPQCYLPSQLLARQLLAQQSNGVVYPSVRHEGGTCLGCFRPALVYRPRQAERYEIRLRASRQGYKTRVRVIPG